VIHRVTGSIALAALLAQAPMTKVVWVLVAPNRIVEYEAGSFVTGRTVPAPSRIFEHPEYLRINARGQMLFTAEPGVAFASGDLASTATRVWVWDGREAHEFPREDEPDTARTWFLSSSGDALYAFENRFAITRDQSGLEQIQRASARLWRTDLAGGRREVVMNLAALPSCTCETGTCSESCPQWAAWSPSGIIDRFLLLTKYVPGQLQTVYQTTTIYRRDGQLWHPATLPQAIEVPLDASPDGSTLVAAMPDAGCCGWMNVSSDQLWALRGGKATRLFDEALRFGNQDYDVSFVPTAARLSPDLARVAYTLVADAPPAGEAIRLSDSGKENPTELARIRQVIATLPAVEIVRLDGPTATRVVIPHASLMGWLNADRVLVVQAGTLAIYSVAGAKMRDTAVAASASTAWLR
jgi:hypothetical protein